MKRLNFLEAMKTGKPCIVYYKDGTIDGAKLQFRDNGIFWESHISGLDKNDHFLQIGVLEADFEVAEKKVHIGSYDFDEAVKKTVRPRDIGIIEDLKKELGLV